MKWFKHRTASHDDPDISDARDKFGDAGYTAFFIILEIYGEEYSHLNSDKELKISLTFLRRKLRKSSTKVQQMLNFYSKRKKILSRIDPEDKDMIFIKVPKFIKLASNWTTRPKKQPTEAPTEAPTAIEVEEEEEVEVESTKEERTRDQVRLAEYRKKPDYLWNAFLLAYYEIKGHLPTWKDQKKEFISLANQLKRIENLGGNKQTLLECYRLFLSSADKFINRQSHRPSLMSNQLDYFWRHVNESEGERDYSDIPEHLQR